MESFDLDGPTILAADVEIIDLGFDPWQEAKQQPVAIPTPVAVAQPVVHKAELPNGSRIYSWREPQAPRPTVELPAAVTPAIKARENVSRHIPELPT